MKTYLPLVVVGAALIASAIVQGIWSERWAPFPELEVYSKRLENIPMDIGDWKGKDAEQIDQRTMTIAGAVGSFSRQYRNSNGDVATVFIVCGRLQDVRYHTPDRCYPANGYEKQGEPAPRTIDTSAKPAEFLSTTFQRSEPQGMVTERVFWTFSAQGDWEAPSSSADFKLRFGGQRALYKLYVIAPPAAPDKASDPATEFIRVLIPSLDKALFPPTAAEPVSAGKQERASAPRESEETQAALAARD